MAVEFIHSWYKNANSSIVQSCLISCRNNNSSSQLLENHSRNLLFNPHSNKKAGSRWEDQQVLTVFISAVPLFQPLQHQQEQVDFVDSLLCNLCNKALALTVAFFITLT